MANISQVKRTRFVIPTTNAFAYAIPVLWDSPMNDTNYAISWSIEMLTQQVVNFQPFGTPYYVNGTINKTRFGFTAIIGTFGDSVTAGDVIVIDALGSHR